MKACQPHYDLIRDGVKSRGLWHLVAQSGEAASEILNNQAQGIKGPAAYDPLLNATMEIYARAVECGGIYLMQGNYCPLCEADKHMGAGESQKWIDGCLDAHLKYCQENGLVQGKQ